MSEWVVVVMGSLRAVFGPYLKDEAEAKALELSQLGYVVEVMGLLK